MARNLRAAKENGLSSTYVQVSVGGTLTLDTLYYSLHAFSYVLVLNILCFSIGLTFD